MSFQETILNAKMLFFAIFQLNNIFVLSFEILL